MFFFWTKQEKGYHCYQCQVQNPASVMVWGCVSAHDMHNFLICESIINAERYVQILELHMLPFRLCVSWDISVFSSRTNQVNRVWVLDLLACSCDLSPLSLRMCGALLCVKYGNEGPVQLHR